MLIQKKVALVCFVILLVACKTETKSDVVIQREVMPSSTTTLASTSESAIDFSQTPETSNSDTIDMPTHDPSLPPLNPEVGDSWVRPQDGMVMVYVPTGSFTMGSSTAEIDTVLILCQQIYSDCEHIEAEFPPHEVTLSGFWLDKTEVTNIQFAQFVNKEGNQTEAGFSWLDIRSEYTLIEQSGNLFQPISGFAEHPVVEVTWYGAQAYCDWALGAESGGMPTDAEWEYAARGEDEVVYPWGNTFDGNKLNVCDTNCDDSWKNDAYNDGFARTAPVGSYPTGTNWVGALDMAGNVWEWVNDWYNNEYYQDSLAENPQGPQSGSTKVIRGGSWHDSEVNSRTAFRGDFTPRSSYGVVGIRCVLRPNR